jgi:hypothetical protein
MPPAKTGKPLTVAQIETLKRWVNEGAEYQPHWAFIPPREPALPAPSQTGWARSPLDLFVLARLESEGLKPQPEADRSTLIRRASLDLTGLPPTPAEIDAFLADRSEAAYERVVDRLLASAQYGERMAVDWMDAARYADTHGYHIDSARDMTAWRDGVIRAFNENQPYDQFTVEQLAGDLLPGATVEQKVASGFNRNHMINYEGGAIAEEYHTAYIVDRINTTATVWLGLTVACAQCHDHKYDPVTMRDYYSLYAIFNGVPENGLDGRHGNAVPTVSLATTAQEAERLRLETAVKTAEARLAQIPASVDAAQRDWEAAPLPEPADKGKAVPESIRNIRSVPAASRTAAQSAEIQKYFREEVSPEMRRLREELKVARKAREDAEKGHPDLDGHGRDGPTPRHLRPRPRPI